MQIFSFSERGRRQENEDFILSRVLTENTSIHVVADGMGGYEHGALAAETAGTTIIDYFSDHYSEMPDPKKLIKEAVNAGNQQLRRIRQELDTEMGTTIAGIFFSGETAYCFWLGDARIYHIRKSKILFQSRDHSYVNDLIDKGIKLTNFEILQYRHIVAKALLGEPQEMNPDLHIINEVSDDDLFMICSDGVHNVVDDPDMEIFLQDQDIMRFTEKIRKRCEQQGRDNYSMIVLSKVRAHYMV